MRILIADDHALMRRGVKETLGEEYPDAEFGEAADVGQTLRQVREQDWDVVVLDISMPGGSGFDVLRRLRRTRPDLPVLILSMYSEEQVSEHALKAGARGYLAKEEAPERLVTAVETILSGRKYVSDSLAERLASRRAAEPERPPHEALTGRESQVLRRIASGRTVAQIAEELSLSPKTVGAYRARILKKMGLSSDAELTRYAKQHRLLADDDKT